MTTAFRVLAAVGLALGLNACAGAPTAAGECCSMKSGGTASGEKSMACQKKAACACCTKGTEGGSTQGHQH